MGCVCDVGTRAVGWTGLPTLLMGWLRPPCQQEQTPSTHRPPAPAASGMDGDSGLKGSGHSRGVLVHALQGCGAVTHGGLSWTPWQRGASLVGLPALSGAASSGIPSAPGAAIPRQTPSDFASTRMWLFDISSLCSGPRPKFLRELRPGCAPQVPQPSPQALPTPRGCQLCQHSGQRSETFPAKSGRAFPGVTGAVGAFQGNSLCGTWPRKESLPRQGGLAVAGG